MIRLGNLVGLDLKLAKDADGDLATKTLSLKIDSWGHELSELVLAIKAGEQFVVVLESVKPRLPLDFTVTKMETA